jgi:hypothetical protein
MHDDDDARKNESQAIAAVAMDIGPDKSFRCVWRSIAGV